MANEMETYVTIKNGDVNVANKLKELYRRCKRFKVSNVDDYQQFGYETRIWRSCSLQL